jgi:hypothetical protein
LAAPAPVFQSVTFCDALRFGLERLSLIAARSLRATISYMGPFDNSVRNQRISWSQQGFQAAEIRYDARAGQSWPPAPRKADSPGRYEPA